MADDFDAQLEAACENVSQKISLGMRSRGMRAANELRNAAQIVLRGQRSGRVYRVPGTKQHYTASAPGEPPANRTGLFRMGWQPKQEVKQGISGAFSALNGGVNSSASVRSYIENDVRTDNKKYVLGSILEDGTGRMAARPYQEKIQKEALPKIKEIYEEPYM